MNLRDKIGQLLNESQEMTFDTERGVERFRLLYRQSTSSGSDTHTNKVCNSSSSKLQF